MERTFNTEEVLKILKDCYITDSVQTLRKWIREGKIIATGSPFKQEGYTIKEEDLKLFIEEERPGFLEILKVYHQVNDKIPLGITLIINRSEPKAITLIEVPEEEVEETALLETNSNELGTILEMLSELEQQIQELKRVVEEDKNEVSEDKEFEKLVDVKIEQLRNEIKNDVLDEGKSQISIVESTTNKVAARGNHREKSKEEFVAFLRKEFWNSRSELGKLKGETHKKFKEEARNCYPLFYDENGRFREKELVRENDNGFKLKIMIDNQDTIIRGENRKELIEQYFEIVFLPTMQNETINQDNLTTHSNFKEEELGVDERYTQVIDLMDKIE
ncbi:hypothetical protein IIK_00422 [Bacillus cereus VD102]|uniref:helix-turn-helix domain-containing protein n=1 Tax=Bacillus cereus group sp. Bc015 TaxID=3018123 RepID=UPI00027A2B47|nr:helix-turn-helix domain-containing protein [Bacillus cereus group sp. Bc015]EJR51880.1 hypothetical protein IIK_00422 [Bacillus cereus VD102]MDA2734495.1 helix-turn-helix domain-containing protein [Bacillus cereus group sp. Bc015]